MTPTRATAPRQPAPGSTNSTKRKKIALFGIFGIGNIGNECTLQAMIHNVRARLRDVALYSICYDPHDTRRRHGLEAVRVSPRDSGSAGHVARSGNKVRRLFRILFRRIPGELLDCFRAFKVLRGTDLVVMTGTGMLTDYSTSAFGYPYDVFKWTLIARLAGCRVRFVGIGVGPLHERLSRRFIKAALALADYRSYRDQLSRTRLGRLGIDSGTDPVFPDLAFSLPTCMFPTPTNHEPHRFIVGLGVMNHSDPHVTGPHDRDTVYRTYLENMREFTVWLIEHGYGVRLLQGDAKHDPAVRRDLRNELEKRGLGYEHPGIVDEDSVSLEELLRQIALTDVVVSPRFHNLILALMLNKPVISISYDPKNDSLLDGFGLGAYCQPIHALQLDMLIDQFSELVGSLEKTRPLIRHRAEENRKLLDDQYRLIFADLEASQMRQALDKSPRCHP